MDIARERMRHAKRRLRARILAVRDSLPAAARAAASRRICSTVASLDAWRDAEAVMLYAAFGSEVNVDTLMALAWRANKKVLLPRVEKAERRIRPYRVDGWDVLVPGTYGIREPDPTRCALWTGPIDAVIVPGVAFDGRGGRMGYGAGYYDRFLTGPADGAVRVAVAFACQVVDAVPLEPHDAPMHCLVTEDGAFRLPASAVAVQNRAGAIG
ncbi:MAG TPA: 5-formyltetrahydrofolate cyclo-ligase [Calditerricola sp.]